MLNVRYRNGMQDTYTTNTCIRSSKTMLTVKQATKQSNIKYHKKQNEIKSHNLLDKIVEQIFIW